MKKFIIIGNQNAITYNEIFPLIKENKMWMGMGWIKEFLTPEKTAKTFGNICWFNNIEHKKHNTPLDLYKKYIPENYPKYVNYDAIEVSRVENIPMDYYGVMGVPISFLDKYCPEQFEIIGLGIANLGIKCGVRPYEPEHKDYRKNVQKRGTVDGDLYMLDSEGHPVVPYSRILIRKRNEKEEQE